MAGFSMRGRKLTIHPVDAARVRPALNPWEKAAATGREGNRLRAMLGGDRVLRQQLRQELSAWVPA